MVTNISWVVVFEGIMPGLTYGIGPVNVVPVWIWKIPRTFSSVFLRIKSSYELKNLLIYWGFLPQDFKLLKEFSWYSVVDLQTHLFLLSKIVYEFETVISSFKIQTLVRLTFAPSLLLNNSVTIAVFTLPQSVITNCWLLYFEVVVSRPVDWVW